MTKGSLNTEPEPAVDEQDPCYEPPAIIWEESFDKGSAFAVACGKTNPWQNDQCHSAPGGS